MFSPLWGLFGIRSSVTLSFSPTSKCFSVLQKAFYFVNAYLLAVGAYSYEKYTHVPKIDTSVPESLDDFVRGLLEGDSAESFKAVLESSNLVVKAKEE
jgi:hypothetical protein